MRRKWRFTIYYIVFSIVFDTVCGAGDTVSPAPKGILKVATIDEIKQAKIDILKNPLFAKSQLDRNLIYLDIMAERTKAEKPVKRDKYGRTPQEADDDAREWM